MTLSDPALPPMKIHELPQGARFEYEGEAYVKTGPMFASGPNGQRLIPRYAVLKPLGGVEATAPKTTTESVSRKRVVAAFQTFYAACEPWVPAERQMALAAARDRFLSALD